MAAISLISNNIYKIEKKIILDIIKYTHITPDISMKVKACRWDQGYLMAVGS